MSLGRALRPLEAALGAAWSIGEVALAAAHPSELGHDPHRELVLADIEARGLHPALEPSSIRLAIDASGRIEGTNPYARLSGEPADRVVAHLARSRRGPSRHLVLVCHCYGVPSPSLMRRLFGLDELPVDVCTNIMTHHQPGTYPLWPGSGFTSARLSRFVENLRSAVAGVRALAEWLVQREGYERVTVIGFSIGGQLALHLAHSADVDEAILYCPVTSLHASATELGLMGRIHRPMKRVFSRFDARFALDDLLVTEPLRLGLRVDPRDLHVIVQRHDALAPPEQVASIRRRYPEARWHELEGTHLYPDDLAAVHRIVRDVVAARPSGRP